MTENERITYLKQLVSVLPDSPGVYQYFDKNGKIIYVGKAKNLKKRVSSYFIKKQEYLKTQILVSKIFDIKHIVVKSEEDALLLENNLIKKYQPRYNILLKDDKSYPWIVIKNEPFPRVFQTRNVVKDGSLYFGPYTSGTLVKSLLDLFKKLYPLRNCNLNLTDENIKQNKFKVCLNYHIHQCCAPCVGDCEHEKYAEYIAGVREILKGNVHSVVKLLREEMMQYADNYEFEKAQEIKLKLEKIIGFQTKSTISSTSSSTVDVFSILSDTDSDTSYVNFLKVVSGAVVQSFTMEFKKRLDETDEEILSYAISEIKSRTKILAREIIVPVIPDVQFEGAKFVIPKQGDKKELLELSERNAKFYKLERLKHEANKNKTPRNERLLLLLKEELGLKTIPNHIECFDNSNIQGAYPVAACVVFRNGKPSKNEYRKFNIKTVEGPDDYASMHEVVYRRYSRLLAEGQELPDLIIADGGVGQMEVIRKAVEDELHLNIPIAGLAKDSRHKTNELLFGFPPAVVAMSKNDQIFRMLSYIQDEVHRFAITFHKQKRSKGMIASELDAIKGIGEVTRKALMEHFKSVKNIRQASFESLSAVIGNSKAKIITEFFGKE